MFSDIIMLEFKARYPHSTEKQIPLPDRSRFLVMRGGRMGAIFHPGDCFSRPGGRPDQPEELVRLIECQTDMSGVPHVYFERLSRIGFENERMNLASEAFLSYYPNNHGK